MAAGTAAFGLDRVITAVIDQGTAFVQSDAAGAGMAIFWLIFLFHIIEGAAEVVDDPKSCRLVRKAFWLRITMVLALLGGYQLVVVGPIRDLQTRYVMNYAHKWSEVWAAEWTAMDAIKQSEEDNRDLKHAEVGGTKAGQGDDSLFGKLVRFAVDGIVTGLGWVLGSIAGVLITLFVLLEGFYGLGIIMVLIAAGPICIAFAAHPKTEGIFWSFAKAFLVFGLLYMPMLGVACGFAGVIMAHMTQMTQGLGAVYGDGSDVALHVILVILGPLCSFAVVRAVPGTLAQLLQAMHSGGGSSFGAGVATAMMVGRFMGGGGGKKGPDDNNDPNGSGSGGKGGALDNAAARGRVEAALGEILRAGGNGSSGPPSVSGQEKKADDIRGDV